MNSNQARKIIDKIASREGDFKIFDFENFAEQDVKEFAQIARNVLKIPMRVENGATKVVIIPEREDYVIKLPLTCSKWFWRQNEREVHKFRNPSDYCEQEWDVYQKAIEMGWQDFFPETEFYKGIIIQERAEVLSDITTFTKHKFSFSEAVIDSASRIVDAFVYGAEVDEDWLQSCVDRYGEETVYNFIEDMENHVSPDFCIDLYEKNVGFKKGDWAPCIIDFSGYDEN